VAFFGTFGYWPGLKLLEMIRRGRPRRLFPRTGGENISLLKGIPCLGVRGFRNRELTFVKEIILWVWARSFLVRFD